MTKLTKLGIVFGLLTIVLVPAGVTLSTRNDWDQAPVCSSAPAASDARCVTEKRGMIEYVGDRTCSGGQFYSCTSLPVDIRFAGGTRRHFEFDGTRLDELFDGGNRDMNVVLDAYHSGGAPSPVIGRFRGRHLVGLVFPTTGASLATDDYPNHRVHEAASLVMYLSPVVLLFASAVWACLFTYLTGRRARRETR